jgi:hypothetical protein
MADFDFGAATLAVNGACDALSEATDSTRQAADLEKAMADYAPSGRWRYAPPDAKEEAKKQVVADQQRAAGERLVALHDTLEKIAPEMHDAIVKAGQAPGPEDSWAARTGKIGLSADQLLQLNVLDELRQARYARELGELPPSAVLARYRAARADASEQSNSTLIRVVEARFADRWRGGAFDMTVTEDRPNLELQAEEHLRTEISDAKSARLPEAAWALLKADQRARAFRQHVEEIRGVKPYRRQA